MNSSSTVLPVLKSLITKSHYSKFNFTIFASACFIFFLFFASCDKNEDKNDLSGMAWTASWGTAQQLVEPHNMPPEPGLSNSTLRQVMRVSIGGDTIRVTFSNEHSKSPVVIKRACIAESGGGSTIDPDTSTELKFNGNPMVTIKPGTTVTSDAFDFSLKPRKDAAITIFFGDTSPDVTGHPGSRTTSYIVHGDMVSAAELKDTSKTDHWYIIDSIEVLTPETSKAVVVIGDSITDGRGSGTNKQNRWPDVLAERLKANPETSDVAVLNMGIGGNCVLRECLGPAAVNRFENDVLDQNGVKWLIILEGINDIGQIRDETAAEETAENLIKAYEEMINLAHEKNILVYGATLLPFGSSFYDGKWRESARQDVNDWIRTGGKFDAVIDLEKALEDPENPKHMLPEADTGDHLHPNETGHRMMADAVDIELFLY